MKKFGLMVIALLVALGAVGAGYAMWSDQILIKGTVTTAIVDINAFEYTSTTVWKTESGTAVRTDNITPTGAIDAFPADTDIDPVAFAKAGPTISGGNTLEDAVTMTFSNLFPLDGARYCTGFSGNYTGTIPVHLAVIWSVVKTEPEYDWARELISKHSEFVITVNDKEVPVRPFQIHQGDTFNISFCINPPQELASHTSMAGKSFDLIGKVLAYQWNEPAPTTAPP